MSLYIKNYQKYNKINRVFRYKNIYQSSTTLEKLTLFYTLEKNVSLKTLIKFASLLELITGQRAYLIRSKKSSVYSKLRKGVPVGVKIILRGKAFDSFLVTFLWETLPTIKNFKLRTQFDKIKQENLTSLIYVITDPLVFFNLKDFYFYFRSCLNLRILFSLSKKSTKQQILFLSCFNLFPC